MIISGIVLAFLSFFLNHYDISDGVLWYISQALIYAGGIFGVSIYFKTRLGESSLNTFDDIQRIQTHKHNSTFELFPFMIGEETTRSPSVRMATLLLVRHKAQQLPRDKSIHSLSLFRGNPPYKQSEGYCL